MESTREHSDMTPPEGGIFRTTHWSVVLSTRERGSPKAEEALAKLCQTYWYPLYVFVRRQGYNPQEAQDLTQDFFARLLQKYVFESVDQKKGRFRTFLLACLRNFLRNDWEKQQAVKRGGQHSFVSWDAISAEDRYHQEPVHALSAEKLFERRWALTLLEKVMSCLRQEYQKTGKDRLFEALQPFLTGEETAQTYAEAALPLQMSGEAAKMAVHRLRQRFRDLLREEIAQTVEKPEEIDDEITQLFAAVG